MAYTAQIVFSPEQEAADGDGWVVSTWDSAESDNPTVSLTNYATITAAFTALEAFFSDDPSIVAYFQGTAEATVLAANSATVNSTRNASITAEGLTP